MAIDSKRIAKNTIFLYARLILVFGVTLYTSRVVLDKLGVDDYGLYNVVFSVIGLLSFLNGTLSSGTSRFITFALGKGDSEVLKTTFSTALCAHVVLAGLILILGETLGIWYVKNVMICPPERFQAAFIVYQISILVTMLSIVLVPFTSEIMAHEEMNFYAYTGIYVAVAKLSIVFLLSRASMDKMVLYAILICCVQAINLLLNVWYSRCKFEEVRFRIRFDKSIFNSILKFSGWNVIASISNTLMSQGVIMLFNIFFLPVVVSAQAISNQISNAMMQLVENVRQAVNPQVIKLFAEGNYDDSKKLTLQSAEFVFYLLLLLGVPLVLIMPNLLDVWLVVVPDYAIVFARLIIIQNILSNFNSAFYIPMVAANKIKSNSLAAAISCVLQFGTLYVLFRCGRGPIWAGYAGIVFCCIWSFVIKPYILWKEVGYKVGEMFKCVLRCMCVMLSCSTLCLCLYLLWPQNNVVDSLVVGILSALCVIFVSFIFIGKSRRMYLITILKRKFLKI